MLSIRSECTLHSINGALHARRRGRGMGGGPVTKISNACGGWWWRGLLTSSFPPSFLQECEPIIAGEGGDSGPGAVEDEEPHGCAQRFAEELVFEARKMRVEPSAGCCKRRSASAPLRTAGRRTVSASHDRTSKTGVFGRV